MAVAWPSVPTSSSTYIQEASMLLVIKLGGEMVDSPELPALAADVRGAR